MRGFVILAQNTTKTDYVKCAVALAMSIRKQMPNEKIALITSNKLLDRFTKYFDYIIPLPYNDLCIDSDWKLSNDWQIYETSPFEYSIKLEADLYVTRDITHWYDTLQTRDLVISSVIRNYKQEISNIRTYRKFIDDNLLPDCYNAVTYFKKSKLAQDFFSIVKDIFQNWESYKTILKCDIDEPATTDFVYAIATHIMGIEKTILPNFKEFGMVHMKPAINNLPHDDWTKILITEFTTNNFRINTVPQLYPVHYHIKNFSDTIITNLINQV